ncbi:MAG: efflux RND transporter periplasmic adaptor subunit [Bacteroidota bacterium]
MDRITNALIMLLIFSSACHRDHHNHPDNQSHSHDALGSQHTLYSQNREFFIEHNPLEAGEEAEFLVHVTQLERYNPATEGHITIQIDGVSVTSGPPHRPGIFEVSFLPEKAGEFHMEVSHKWGETVESVTAHVHVYRDHDDLHTSGSEAHEHEAEQEGEITFLKEQAWKSDFMVTEVVRGPISTVILTSGEIIAAPGKTKQVDANTGGIVIFAHKNLVQGTLVTKGQHLFTISGKSIPGDNHELAYQQAFNSLEKSRSEYIRHKRLSEGGALSERQLLESRSAYIDDSLRFYSLAAHTSEEGLKVYAPVSGSIHDLYVSEGAHLEAGERLVKISSDQVLLLRADIPQQYHNQAKSIISANFRTAYSQELLSIDDFGGRHLATGRSVAENNHYLPVYFELQNDGRLLEGAYAEIYLKTEPVADRIVVPLGAITEEQGAHYVYLQATGESYSKRSVHTGADDGKQVEILEGLEAGERIVTRGVILVKAASVVKGVVGHGHSH